jgi:hypothetical protein
MASESQDIPVSHSIQLKAAVCSISYIYVNICEPQCTHKSKSVNNELTHLFPLSSSRWFRGEII